MFRTVIPALILMTSFVATSAHADIWAEADGFYADRKNNRSAIASARSLYKEILVTATGTDALRAASQLGRLAIYEGEMLLPKTASAARKEIFGDCWCKQPRVGGLIVPSGSCREPGFIDSISPQNLGEEHPAYYYFFGVCLAYWGEQGSLREKLAFSGDVTRAVDKGQALDTRFDGGGIHRLAAGVYSNPQADLLGLYQPDYALEEIQKALRVAAYPGDPSTGAAYYDNWQGMIQVLRELQEYDEAIAVMEEVLPELQELIEDDALPRGREPEAIFNYKMLKSHWQDLTSEVWEDSFGPNL